MGSENLNVMYKKYHKGWVLFLAFHWLKLIVTQILRYYIMAVATPFICLCQN